MWIFVWNADGDRNEKLEAFGSLADAWDFLRDVRVGDVPDQFVYVVGDHVERLTFAEFLVVE
jgi:hypothetical protein